MNTISNWKLYNRREYRPSLARRGVRTFTVLVAFLCCFVLYEEEELLSPVSLYQPAAAIEKLIAENGKRYSLSPELLQSVILTESKYNTHAVSSTGAVGVMQLMPDTAEWISGESGLPANNLRDPAENIPLGAWYLEFLIEKYEGNLVLALAAYNAGRGNVDDWMKTYHWPKNYADISGIPFPETREFVKSVIESRDQLREERKKGGN